MIIDLQTTLSDAQALTGTAASTNYINLGSDHDIGVGKSMSLVVTFDVALAGTSPTLAAAIQTDDNSSFSSATTLVTSQTLTAAAVGDQLVIPLPPTNEQYIRAYYTLGGTSPTATVTASIMPSEMVQNNRVVPTSILIA